MALSLSLVVVLLLDALFDWFCSLLAVFHMFYTPGFSNILESQLHLCFTLTTSYTALAVSGTHCLTSSAFFRYLTRTLPDPTMVAFCTNLKWLPEFWGAVGVLLEILSSCSSEERIE